MKICIVGGGSSGWMTASTPVKAFPEWDITLIESPKVATVGVGESTTQYFRSWVHFLGLKDEDWMPACDATYKISVRFHNFHKVGDAPWQYPFGRPRQVVPPDVWWYGQSKRGWGNEKFAQDFSWEHTVLKEIYCLLIMSTSQFLAILDSTLMQLSLQR